MKRRVGGLSESDLLGQRAIREIGSSGTREALRQHTHVRRCRPESTDPRRASARSRRHSALQH